MSKMVLELQSLGKIYGGAKALEVLKDVSLSLEKNTISALIGPSGSGKTTLLQMAGLLDEPTSGDVLLQGELVSTLSDQKRTALRNRQIGFVYQFHHLLPEFSALENVMMPQLIAGVAEADAQKRAEELLDLVGLSARSAHGPSELSGGEQQRVAIARALANKPAVLLADEPTGNLDEDTAEQVFSLLMKVVREEGTAALIATHNLELAKQMDVIYRVDHGRILKV